MIGIDTFTPNYSAATGLLSHLNSEELKELLNDEDKLEGMIKDLQQIKNIEIEREMIVASNKSIAEYNLNLKPTLEDSRYNITELYSRASDLKSEVTLKKKKLESRKTQSSLDTILAILQAKTAEIEEAAELHVEKMLKKEIDVDEFLNVYLKTKTDAHVLHTKVDKMREILNNPNQPYVRPAPMRIRKASRPPPPPPPPLAKEAPQQPGISPNQLPCGTPKTINNVNTSDLRVIVPTRIAPKPPKPQVPSRKNNVNQVTSAFNALDIYSSQRVPVLPNPTHRISVPKKC